MTTGCVFSRVEGERVSGESCERVRYAAVTVKVNLPVLHIPRVQERKKKAHDSSTPDVFLTHHFVLRLSSVW